MHCRSNDEASRIYWGSWLRQRTAARPNGQFLHGRRAGSYGRRPCESQGLAPVRKSRAGKPAPTLALRLGAQCTGDLSPVYNCARREREDKRGESIFSQLLHRTVAGRPAKWNTNIGHCNGKTIIRVCLHPAAHSSAAVASAHVSEQRFSAAQNRAG